MKSVHEIWFTNKEFERIRNEEMDLDTDFSPDNHPLGFIVQELGAGRCYPDGE